MSNIFDIKISRLAIPIGARVERNLDPMRSQLFVGLLSPLLVLLPGSLHNQTSTPAATQPVQVRNAIQFDLSVPPAQAAPLFGPEGERCWAGGNWDPHFVFPQPAHDQQDAVFTIAHGPYNMTWVNTVFNLAEGHMQYVAFIPSALVMTVDVHLTPSPSGTHVDVTFVHTSLDPAVNAKVAEMAEHHRNAGPEWVHDIESCLKQHRDPL